MNKNCYFIFVCVLIGIILCACSTQKIEFKRESAFDKVMKDAMQQKDSIKQNNNIYIYKYNDNKKIDNSSIKFGPKDVNFDLPIKIK